MDEWLKYLVWVGWFLAAVAVFLGRDAILWIAAYELIVGVILGLNAFKGDIPGLFERAVFYSVGYGAMGLFDLRPILGFELTQWITIYLGLMAWLYVPAAFFMYIAKIFKEGY